MSYTALYRKFRPVSFTDVKGQDAIISTLRNQIQNARIGHAYLFCGTRGTGKTTVAKILARAINCENPVNGDPCGKCRSCISIAADANMNVVEMDAASHNGVDDVRQIESDIEYSPSEGKYRVYIIDEVHMMSSAAFNALLKTLEEPPAYVVFILATTDVHKLPITVLSRCQRYDFRRISTDIILERVKELMGAEGFKADDRALHHIARTADGSLRDALSLLDQCLAFNYGETLTLDKTLDVLGTVDHDILSRLLRSIAARDVREGIAVVSTVSEQGREFAPFIGEFLSYLRSILLIQASIPSEDVLDISIDNMNRIQEEAEMVSQPDLMMYIKLFSDLSDKLRYSSQKRLLTEILIIRLCSGVAAPLSQDAPAFSTSGIISEQDAPPFRSAAQTPGIDDFSPLYESLEQRVLRLENRIHRLNEMERTMASTPAPASVDQQSTAPVLPGALPKDLENILANMGTIVSELPSGIKQGLKAAKITAPDNHILILMDRESLSQALLDETAIKMITDKMEAFSGRSITVEYRLVDSEKTKNSNYPDWSGLINMDIEIMEDEDG